jgi:hypothetical protein
MSFRSTHDIGRTRLAVAAGPHASEIVASGDRPKMVNPTDKRYSRWLAARRRGAHSNRREGDQFDLPTPVTQEAPTFVRTNFRGGQQVPRYLTAGQSMPL